MSEHLYTTDENEVAVLTDGTHGWTSDFNGQACFYSGGELPVYRLYNQRSGRHMFTTSEYEYNKLPEEGDWKQEGAKFYGLT